MTGWLLAAPVGLVFLFAGFIKSIDFSTFLSDLASYKIFKTRLRPVAMIITGLEWALGSSLLLFIWPRVLLPVTVFILIILASITLWAGSRRSLTDCGCYGGLILLSPKQSAFLDIIFAGLLIGAWFNLVNNETAQTFLVAKLCLIILLSLVGSGLCLFSRKKPLLDFKRLKKGKHWKSSWLPDNDFSKGEHFIVFMSKRCPYCKRWVPLMNVMNAQGDFPEVSGILSLSSEDLKEFKTEHYIRFPLVIMSKILFSRMTNAHPTAILTRDGVIEEVWKGKIPEPYFSRIKQFIRAIHESSENKVYSG
jgi:hypothetical protein